MVTNKENLFKLGAKLTDRIPQMLGLKKITEEDPEYWGMVNVLDDEMVEIALKLEKRKPQRLAEIAKKTGKDPAYLEQKLFDMAKHGLVEYNWENKDREKQYLLPLFVPGIAELFLMLDDVAYQHPETSDFFNAMTQLPLQPLTKLIPPGGAGVGMHVIPVEKAIPGASQSVSIEHLSHWLDKYEGHLGVSQCSCRRSQTIRGEATGDVSSEWCMTCGDFADYTAEIGCSRYIDKTEALAILQKAEDNGYVHQITNIDGENKIFAICNCAPGVCYALRTSQLFNTPNMSASAYRAKVDTKKCVACGKCVEVCPAGAARLGQKLCTKHGFIEYQKHPLPDSSEWGPVDWNENYREDNLKHCYDTGTSPCKAACPAHIAVQGYIKMASEGRYLDALKLIKQDNPFPAICGSICNRRCEKACTRGDLDQPLAIDEIKRFVAELELKEETRYIPQKLTRSNLPEDYTNKIAVIGAGPAGLSCAFYLARLGYPVTVFDRNPAPGGMMLYGIPSFRLERNVIKAEIDVLRKMGVAFECGVEIGKDKTIDDLRKEDYEAFYLAIGAQKSAAPNLPGEDREGVLGGVDFMRDVNLGSVPAIGKKVAVIGGGNVAMDVCRTAVRLGAEEVTVIYRRSENEMTADREELAEAKAEGVSFLFLHNPVEILAGEGEAKNLLKVEKMVFGEEDPDGRRKVSGTGEFETIACDSVIFATGQKVDLGFIAPEAMCFNRNGTVIADPVTYQTAQSDIFAGGDCVTGPKFCIDAIAAGRQGAESIHRFVHKGHSLTIARDRREFIELDKKDTIINGAWKSGPQRQVPMRDESKAKSFSNDKLPFTEEQVKKEASRCLGCGASIVDENQCIGCGLCTTRCEFDAIHLERTHPDASRMVPFEDKLNLIMPYMAKRGIKILKNKI